MFENFSKKVSKLARFVVLSLMAIGVAGIWNPSFAKDFALEIQRDYIVDSLEFVRVEETHTITNNSTSQLISSNNTERFPIIVIQSKNDTVQAAVNSAIAYQDGVIRDFGQIDENGYTQLEVGYSRNIGVGQSSTFKVEYNNYGMIERKGALIDIYAPGFAADFSFGSDNTDVTYTTRVILSDELPEINFVAPEQNQVSNGDGRTIYTIPQKELIGQNIWFQLGTKQFYEFEITQEALASETQNRGNYNEYKVVIPRDIQEAKINQKVYYEEIHPELYEVDTDQDGNLIGVFRIPSHQTETIRVTGYAEVSSEKKTIDSSTSGDVTDLGNFVGVSDYLAGSQFWEVNHPEVKGLADELKADNQNVYQIVETTYEHIINTIDYSQVKRFGINERQGALKTLQGGAAVCMEYSDLFLTLTRAQGIPARAAFGYGYDSLLPEDEQEAHQWVQVYIPGLEEWISVDVTWGESGSSLIGGDLNHFYTHFASIEPESPASVERKSFGNPPELEAPEFSIKVRKNIPGRKNLATEESLKEDYPLIQESTLGDLKDRVDLFSEDQPLLQALFENVNLIVYAAAALIVLVAFAILRFFMKMISSIGKQKKKEEIVLENIEGNKPLPPISEIPPPVIGNTSQAPTQVQPQGQQQKVLSDITEVLPTLPTKDQFENEGASAEQAPRFERPPSVPSPE